MRVVNWSAGKLEWENPYLTGPPLGPEVGDLDGDGRDEMVIIAPSSNSSGGRILVFDAVRKNIRATSGAVMSGSISDFKLRDVNGDNRMEILLAGSYSGLVVYAMDVANLFSIQWQSASNSINFNSVEAADVDGDRQMEIIGGSDGYLFVFSYTSNSGPQEWQSLYLRGNAKAIAAEDMDADGNKEMIAMVQGADVCIFDGRTKVLKAMIVGPFTAMELQKIGGVLSIALGKNTGELLIYQYSSGAYKGIYAKQVINSSIDGLSIDARDRIWTSTNGTYPGYSATLSELLLDGTALASYSGYGHVFGLRVVLTPSRRFFYAAGYYSISEFPLVGAPASSDMDGDGKTDVTVWRPDTGFWFGLPTTAPGTYTSTQWGVSTDQPVLGDYDGDLKADLAVWRAQDASWYILPSSKPAQYLRLQWGASADRRVPEDYDGDGITDLAVWYPATGVWYVLPSKTRGTHMAIQWGFTTGIPVPGDYDGDSKSDYAVWRPSTGVWYILLSDAPGSFRSVQWGTGADIPVPGDYNGDGKIDAAVWRPSSGFWYILPSAAPDAYIAFQWGSGSDVPAIGDYDGDGKADIAVWRPEAGAPGS